MPQQKHQSRLTGSFPPRITGGNNFFNCHGRTDDAFAPLLDGCDRFFPFYSLLDVEVIASPTITI